MLNSLEKFVINEFLKSRGDGSSIVLDNISVNRSISAVGFMTEIEESSRPNILGSRENFTGCDLVVKVNSSIDTGYILYVKNGLLEAIEGHTYGGENWPSLIESFVLSDNRG